MKTYAQHVKEVAESGVTAGAAIAAQYQARRIADYGHSPKKFWTDVHAARAPRVRAGDRVRLIKHPKLKDLSGKAGLVVKVNPKTIAVLMDADVETAGSTMIRKADEARYLRGETVKNMQGADVRDTARDQDGPAFGVSFYQLAEDWAALVYPAAIAEVLS